MLLHDDVIYQILLWLPVISLLRFKNACRSWRALIGSSNFIKQHLHRHHYDLSLKDKNQNLIYLVPGINSHIIFPLTSIEGFEEPNSCLRLKCSDLHGYFPNNVLDIMSYNGIVCLNLLSRKLGDRICLWNPATKQCRVLPQLRPLNKVLTAVGFGFDVKRNDYKVVNLIGSAHTYEIRVEVYSLNTGAWKSLTTDFSFFRFVANPMMPFKNGTCFFWRAYNFIEDTGIICFDFSSEMFRSIYFPCADWEILKMSVVHDNIACVIRTNDHQTEIWAFTEYGTVNESWTKLYTVGTYLTIDKEVSIVGVSMNGNYIFFRRMGKMCRFNVVTKETNCLTMPCYYDTALLGFKESLVSVEEGNNASICINKRKREEVSIHSGKRDEETMED